ncbi:MAG: GNAT superfamily N-acetyltransferase [Planctomycetota bacterium]|jgi:GNAT superfamily N-acetyltransferase
MLKQAITNEEIQKCFPVMAELRPHLKAESFLDLVRYMETEGFKMVYIEQAEEVVAVASYRIFTNLFMGKNLYVDDLVTSESVRSKGYGETLVSWLRSQAIENECAFFHLDSGTQRHQAHKFYFKQGFTIASYHFSENLI